MLFLALLLAIISIVRADLHILTCISNEEGTRVELDSLRVYSSKYSYSVQWVQSLEPWRHYPEVHIKNVCGEGVPWKGFRTKPTNVLKYVRHLPSNDVVLFTDGTDVVFNVNDITPEILIARFKSFNTHIVTMAEPHCWVGRKCSRAEMEKFYPEAVSEKSACPAFLNSGAYIGYATAIKTSLEIQQRIFDNPKMLNSDQRAMTIVRHRHPWLITLDTNQQIFASITSANLSIVDERMSPCSGYSEHCGYNTRVEDEWTRDIRRKNTEKCALSQSPVVIHANGPTDTMLEQFQTMLLEKNQKKMPICAGILAYQGVETLKNTLDSYVRHGLFDMLEQVYILFQKTDSPARKRWAEYILRKYPKLKPLYSTKNIHHRAFIGLADACQKSEYVILLEEDFKIANVTSQHKSYSPPPDVRGQFLNAIHMLQSGGASAVRMRSRQNSGIPNYSMGNLRSHGHVAPNNIMSYIHVDYFAEKRFPELYVCRTTPKTWCTPFEYGYFTNNPTLYKTSFLRNMFKQVPDDRFDAHKFEPFLMRWWIKQSYIVAASEGIFTHERLDRAFLP